MPAAPPPPREAERLEALRRYRLLDTGPEAAFDDLTALAAHVCGTPVALMTLLDSDRQWFKSRYNFGASETPRDIAFCGHAILGDGPMVVEDAALDARFAANPLVTADPHVRFYAGAAMRDPAGHALGTVCVMDQAPRQLSGAQLDALSRLARQASALIEARHVATLLAESLEQVRALKALLPVCAWCRRLRDPAGNWRQVEDYLREQAGQEVTHGLCGDCLATQLGEGTGEHDPI